MSKNTRWALAIAGVLVLIAAAVVISTGKDETTATEPGATQEATAPVTGNSGATTSTTGATGGNNGSGGNGNGSGGSTAGTGGASPNDGTGGTSPQDEPNTGGAKAGSVTPGPLLRAGKSVTIKTSKGDTVYLRARSGTTDELHIHGYDYTVDLPAGETVKYKFMADIAGVFEIEFENQGLQVAELKVSP